MTTVQTLEDGRIRVRLGDLGLAPENLRFEEPADEGVPRLADTIDAAGMIYPPIVRKGRKGEQPFMVLDGRRRRFALLLRVDRGDASLDDEVECLLATSRAAQAAAAVLTNSEHAPVHLADVILAIGKLRKAKMSTAAIAAALGYDELEIKRLEALSTVHPNVLTAFRRAKLTLRQVRLFARVKDLERQGHLAETALDGYFSDYHIEELVQRGRVTIHDPRFVLVGAARYAEAGGRMEVDLFGELPDTILDPDLLTRLWRARAEELSAGIAEKDLTVLFGEDGGYRAPDGLYPTPFVMVDELSPEARVAFDEAQARFQAAYDRIQASGEAGPADPDIADMLMARLDAARAKLLAGTIEAVILSPRDVLGLEARFFWQPPPVEPAAEAEMSGGPDDEDEEEADTDRRDEVLAPPPVLAEVEGVAHGLHEVRTDLATRGLIRSLADSPQAALIALVAQLFKGLALQGPVSRESSALTVGALRYSCAGRKPVASLDGEVRARLDSARTAYLASGLRPIGYVAGLSDGDRLALLAELVAVTLDLHEARTSSIRREARAEAQEIAALCGADLTAHWTPDAPFLTAHTKPQLLAMVSAMAVEDPRAATLKKDELVNLVAAQAAERRWAPSVVQWGAAASADPDDASEGGLDHGEDAPAGEAAVDPLAEPSPIEPEGAGSLAAAPDELDAEATDQSQAA